MKMRTNMRKRCFSIALAFTIAIVSLGMSTAVPVDAASSSKTGIGLAEFGLKAYRDGWLYGYGDYGQIKNGSRYSDCSGLIYAYLCWKDDSSNPVHNGDMPRGATSQANACSKSGPISTLPRTHGLLLTYPNYDHIGIYVGNGKSVDNSDYGTNMVYRNVSQRGWIKWHKLDVISYPTNGWYEFDGDPFYYVDGEYVIDTSKTIDGVKYTFDSSGTPSPTPDGFTSGGGSDGNSGDDMPDKVSLSAKTTADVNLRTGPSTDYNRITTIDEGTKITVTNKDNSNWYKVKTADKTSGYMASDYIKLETATATPKPPSDNTSAVSIKATTTVDKLCLRSSASTNSTVLRFLSKGTNLTIIQKTNSSWYKVKLADGTTGYVYASYIKESSTTAATSIKAYTTATVKLRKTASGTGTVLKEVPKNTNLTITSKSNKSWYKVKLSDGTTGYISSQYLKAGTYKKPATSIKAYTTGNDVCLRKTAGGAMITTVKKNTNLTITSKSNKDWYQVKLANGTTGFMSSKYLKEGTYKAPSASTSIKAYTTADVRIRKTANGAIIKELPKNTNLTITSKSNKSWYKVKLSDGTTGYISSQYLKEGTYKAPSASVKAYTTAADVRLRKTANGTIIKTLPKNTNLTITSKSNKSWYKVKLSDGTTGYISSKYLKEGTYSTAKTMTTTVDVRLRKNASSAASSTILMVVPKSTKVTVTSTSNKSWYKVKTSSGKVGYISSEYLK